MTVCYIFLVYLTDRFRVFEGFCVLVSSNDFIGCITQRVFKTRRGCGAHVLDLPCHRGPAFLDLAGERPFSPSFCRQLSAVTFRRRASLLCFLISLSYITFISCSILFCSDLPLPRKLNGLFGVVHEVAAMSSVSSPARWREGLPLYDKIFCARK